LAVEAFRQDPESSVTGSLSLRLLPRPSCTASLSFERGPALTCAWAHGCRSERDGCYHCTPQQRLVMFRTRRYILSPVPVQFCPKNAFPDGHPVGPGLAIAILQKVGSRYIRPRREGDRDNGQQIMRRWPSPRRVPVYACRALPISQQPMLAAAVAQPPSPPACIRTNRECGAYERIEWSMEVGRCRQRPPPRIHLPLLAPSICDLFHLGLDIHTGLSIGSSALIGV
jgi:hypothetical protein